MKIIDQALERIKRGREGLNKGLPMGFNRLVEYLPNIQQATYYLLGGSAKVGKSGLAADMFVFNPYEYVVNHPGEFELDIDYYSFEIEKVSLMVKAIARRLYYKYGIKTDVNELLQRGNKHCSDGLWKAANECRDYYAAMEDMVHIHDIPFNPTGINKYLWAKAAQHGTVVKKPIEIIDEEGLPIRTIQVFDRYIPNNPNRYHIVILDHIGLMHLENGNSIKQNLDKMSQYFVSLRNNFNIIPVVVQQLGFDLTGTDRIRSASSQPTLHDFSDSKYLSRDKGYRKAIKYRLYFRFRS